jgi:hypothetical protein
LVFLLDQWSDTPLESALTDTNLGTNPATRWSPEILRFQDSMVWMLPRNDQQMVAIGTKKGITIVRFFSP